MGLDMKVGSPLRGWAAGRGMEIGPVGQGAAMALTFQEARVRFVGSLALVALAVMLIVATENVYAQVVGWVLLALAALASLLG